MIGYGPCSNGRAGLCKPVTLPDLKIAGLEFEASTYARGGGMPLLHDHIISITTSNGGWYDKKGEDDRICIYTFGYVMEVDLGEGHRPVFAKTRSSEYAAHLAWAALDKLGYDFVNVLDTFNFDLKHMAVCAAGLGQIARFLEKKRLGNFGSGVFMKLTRGCMFVDSMYTAMKTPRPGQWSSFGLAYMGLGPARVGRQGAHHVQRLTTFASVDESCIQDATADNVGMMVFCVQQSVCMASGMCIDLSATSGSDERWIEDGLMLDPVPGVYKGGPHGKMGVDLPEGCSAIPIGDLFVNDAPMGTRTKDLYLCIARGGPTILSTVIRKFISERKTPRANGDEELAAAYKPSTTATFSGTSSKWAIAATIGVWKAGGTVVTLDCNLPDDRIQTIAERDSPGLVLASRNPAAAVSGESTGAGQPGIDMLAVRPVLIQPSDLLDVVFTPGSTGTPKGVMLQHRNLASASTYMSANLGFGPHSRVYDFAAFSFDISWSNIDPTLTNGGCLGIPTDDQRRNNLAAWFRALGGPYRRTGNHGRSGDAAVLRRTDARIQCGAMEKGAAGRRNQEY
ncbi:hypothetical protein DL768_003856 [Monosporascus sp. mg162]|nr:hypothetical protein DL768_003856 [Monosporascus sp. mg162]